MKRFYAWRGPGHGYDRPDNGDALSTPNMWGRQGSAPKDQFRFKQGPASIMSASGNNQSGTSYESVNEGVNPAGQGSFGSSKPSS